MSDPRAVELLDEALRVGARELDALVAGDVDLASELCEQRAELISKGWSLRTDDMGDLRSRLVSLRHLQERLSLEGGKLRQQIQDRLNQSKKQVKRMRGYGQAVGFALT